MKPKTKVYEGWFSYANDYEYGPTLVKWKNKTTIPDHKPHTRCCDLDDKNFEEIFLVPTEVKEVEWWNYPFFKAKITVEILDVKTVPEED